MLIDLIVAGIIPVGGTEINPGTGTVSAPAARTAAAAAVTLGAGSGPGIPPSAFMWAQPLDPADRTFYVMDWTTWLGNSKIAALERLTMSALGASLGVEIDTDADRLPVIDAGAQKIGIWFKVDPSFQANAAFQSPGIKVGIAALVRTNDPTYQEFERTWELTVAQL